MGFTNIVSLLGGVALFLFGMSVMGDSLKKVAGNKLEVILYKLSSNPIKGILIGTGVTAVIQSSSATSVMVVGFVNSGMMKVNQAIGIIMGAILGTSITGWILCLNSISGSGASIAALFSTAVLTGVTALIGIVMRMAAKKSSTKHVGEILLGFAVLMYGMSAMSGAVAPLRESPEFISLLTKFSNPAVGILVGLVFTAILQSASAAVGILQALAVTGAISFNVAFPVLLGIGIGASVPVLLSELGASVNAKRTAFVYLVIDVLGAIICGTVFYAIDYFVNFGFTDNTMTMISIAFVNTFYRLVTVLVLTPFIGLLDRFVCRVYPDNPEALAEQADFERLESRFLAHPALSIEQSRLVINSMAEKSRENLFDAMTLRKNYSAKLFARVEELEGVIDRYEDKLGQYLVKITGAPLNEEQTRVVSRYLHTLSDLERISDHAENIGETATEIEEKKIHFSHEATHEILVLESAIKEIVNMALDSFINNDIELAKDIEPLEEVIDGLCDQMKYNHVMRLQNNSCTLENGFVFNDLITDYERIADHCSNIGVAILETDSDELLAHEYKDQLKDKHNEHFTEEFKRFSSIFRF